MGKHPGCKWKDEFYWRIFELVRKGWSEPAIAKVLGTTQGTYRKWIKKNPTLRKCIKDAIDPVDERDKGYRTFRDFIYGRLDPELQDLWDEIEAVEDQDKDSTARIKFLLKDQGRRVRQHLFLYSLFHCNFLVSSALRKTCTNIQTLQHWIKTDPRFGDLLDEIHTCKKDFFESCLINLCRQGDSAAILFANRTLNRDRGYNDKVEVDIKHTHEHKIDELELSVAVRREILDAMRRSREVPQLEYKGEIQDAEFTVIPKEILEKEDKEND